MPSKMFRSIVLRLPVVLLIVGCAGGTASLDPGDGSSGNLMWGASHYSYSDRDPAKAMAYCDKLIEQYGDKARELQASLSDFPATDPPEATFRYNDLNHVAAAHLIKADLLMDRGDREGAEEALTTLIEDYGYAQIQDLGEWGDYASAVERGPDGFVKLAEVAEWRLGEIREGGN